MPNSKTQTWEWMLLAFLLLSLCVTLTCLQPWGADESVIELQLRHFLDTGHLTYLFQHYNARLTFGKVYYEVVLFLQRSPLDPATYALARIPVRRQGL